MATNDDDDDDDDSRARERLGWEGSKGGEGLNDDA